MRSAGTARTAAASRVAVMGGVYANHVALRAAIASARSEGAEAIYCLGDLGAFGPHPDRAIEIVREEGVITMAGNYDDSIGRGLDDCQCGYTDPRDNHFARLSYRYAFDNTSSENRAYLAALPRELRVDLGARRVLLCHGSPRRMNEFLWESTTPTHFLEKLCDDHRADVILATHTGIKWQRALAGGRRFVNVGVVGRPENDGTTRVHYALLDAARDEARFVAVEYDHEALAHEMECERLPAEFTATIRTGFWTTCLEVLPSKERRRGRW